MSEDVDPAEDVIRPLPPVRPPVAASPVSWPALAPTLGIGAWELWLSEGRWLGSVQTQRILGTSEVVTVGGFLERVHAEDRAALQQALAEVQAGHEPLNREIRLYRADGELRYVQIWAELRLDEAGQPAAVAGTLQDLTERRRAEADLQMRVAQQAAVASLGQRALKGGNLAALRQEAAGVVARGFALQLVKIVEFDEAAGVLRVVAGMGWEMRPVIGHTYALAAATQAGLAWRERGPVILQDARTDARVRDSLLLHEHGVRSGLSVLIAGERGPWGVLSVFARELRTFTPEDVDFCQSVANVLAEATRRARAEEALRVSDALLRIAGRTASLGGWSVALPTGRFVWSEEVCAIHGLPTGTSPDWDQMLAYVDGRGREVFRAALVKCASEGVPFDLEHEITNARGHRLWVRVNGQAARDEEGVIVQLEGALQDVSARKHTLHEVQRQASFARYNPNPVLELSAAGEVLYANAAAADMARQLLGRRPTEMLPPESREIVRECLLSGKARLRLETQAGDRTISWSFFPILPHQTVHCYAGDITDRKRAEAAVVESEERFRRVAKATNDAICDWDIERDRLWWSEGFTRLFGFAGDEIEAGLASWINRIHPEDREEMLRSGRRAIEQGVEMWEGEHRFLRKDGSAARVRYRGGIIRDHTGRPVRVVGGLTDLTEQRAAEARLVEQAALLDKAQDAILVCDLEQRVTFWNKSAERLYGWSATDALGRALSEVIRMPADALQQAHAQVLATGEWSGEATQADRQGRLLIVEGRWTLVRDAEGRPMRILKINTDVTRQRGLEQQFIRAQRLDSIGTLAGGMAHDLNNVLSPIVMSVELLRSMVTDPAGRELLTTMATSARRGADMVGQVLAFARGVEGRRVEVMPARVLAELGRIIKDTFPKNITIEVLVRPDVGWVLGDPTQLHQVLLNLCVNARDALPDGGRLSLRAEHQLVDAETAAAQIGAKAGPHVALIVEDNGTGIPPAVLDKIFDPFFTTKAPGKGTGLGLSTTLAIVKGHGGFIQVTSTPGQGTCFCVLLPVRREPAPDAAPKPTPAAAPTPAGPPRGKGELVLVIDDESAIRMVAQQMLEAYGYRVVTAGDGAEGLRIFKERQQEVAIVLTDMMMPGMDGPAVIRALLELEPTLRIIAASGAPTGSNNARKMAGQIKHFLPKPFTVMELLRVLHETLAAPSAKT